MFGVAGLAKLADRAGSTRALVEFGVPALLAKPLGIALPLAELAIALALLPLSTAWLAASAALVLLLIFVAAIAFNLAKGRQPDCHCFGQISSSPAGWGTLARNVFLAGAAALIVWQGSDNSGPSMVAWFAVLTIPERVLLGIAVVGLAFVAAEGWVLLQVLRQQGRLLIRLDAIEAKLNSGVGVAEASNPGDEAAGLATGAVAPRFRLRAVNGMRHTLQSLLSDRKPVVLVFTHPGCGPCKALMPEIGRYQREHAPVLTIAVLSEGSADENRAMEKTHDVSRVLLQKGREVAEDYQAYGTPSAVLIHPDGKIGSALAMGSDSIRALIERTAAQHRSTNGNHETVSPESPPEVGQSAPSFTLPDVSGNLVALDSFRGKETLLLFWNPDCGFCQQMLDDLKAWETNSPHDSPTLLVVSTGSVEDNAAMSLRSTVVIDADFEVPQSFGAGGTPMAVLLDAHGRIASDVAAGANAVFTLARAAPNVSAGIDRPL